MSYTYIFNNAFLDWGIDKNFLINIKDKKMDRYDGGDVPFTSTPLPMVAQAVASVLEHPDETKNKAIRVHGARLTQNKFLEIAQRVVGKEGWQITEKSSSETEKQSYEDLKNDPGNFLGWAFGFLMRAIYGEGFGGDFSKNNDNEFLGLTELNEKEVEDIVRSQT